MATKLAALTALAFRKSTDPESPDYETFIEYAAGDEFEALEHYKVELMRRSGKVAVWDAATKAWLGFGLKPVVWDPKAKEWTGEGLKYVDEDAEVHVAEVPVEEGAGA